MNASRFPTLASAAAALEFDEAARVSSADDAAAFARAGFNSIGAELTSRVNAANAIAREALVSSANAISMQTAVATGVAAIGAPIANLIASEVVFAPRHWSTNVVAVQTEAFPPPRRGDGDYRWTGSPEPTAPPHGR